MTAHAFFRDRKVIPLQLMDLIMFKVNKLAKGLWQVSAFVFGLRCWLCGVPLSTLALFTNRGIDTI